MLVFLLFIFFHSGLAIFDGYSFFSESTGFAMAALMA
jgi:hypothetical protein